MAQMYVSTRQCSMAAEVQYRSTCSSVRPFVRPAKGLRLQGGLGRLGTCDVPAKVSCHPAVGRRPGPCTCKAGLMPLHRLSSCSSRFLLFAAMAAPVHACSGPTKENLNSSRGSTSEVPGSCDRLCVARWPARLSFLPHVSFSGLFSYLTSFSFCHFFAASFCLVFFFCLFSPFILPASLFSVPFPSPSGRLLFSTLRFGCSSLPTPPRPCPGRHTRGLLEFTPCADHRSLQFFVNYSMGPPRPGSVSSVVRALVL